MSQAEIPADLGAPEVLPLTSILDLKAASGLQRDLVAHRGRDLVMDAGDVSRLGGLCLQVLLAAAAAWRSDGLSLAIVNPSEAFTKALDLFGARFDDGSHKELLA